MAHRTNDPDCSGESRHSEQQLVAALLSWNTQAASRASGAEPIKALASSCHAVPRALLWLLDHRIGRTGIQQSPRIRRNLEKRYPKYLIARREIFARELTDRQRRLRVPLCISGGIPTNAFRSSPPGWICIPVTTVELLVLLARFCAFTELFSVGSLA